MGEEPGQDKWASLGALKKERRVKVERRGSIRIEGERICRERGGQK
jgi:hypothetical protein